MATQRYTITLGQRAQDVVQSAGGAIGTDTMQLNVDLTNMKRGDAIILLQQLEERILEAPWPPA